MIEIVCKNGLQEEEKKLCLPKNIRQVGSPRGRHKIYIEDYVYTYLKAVAQKKECCAVVFLGESQVMKEIRYTFVSGAVECGSGVFQWDSICLDENFWNYIEKEKQQYFPEKEIVGWFLGKTGQAMELAPVVEAAHRKYFSGRDKILMLMDILEQEEVFFIYDQGYLQKREGYYIYYEKNLPMQEYMVQKKEEDTGEQAEEREYLPMRDAGERPRNQEIPEMQDVEDTVDMQGAEEMQGRRGTAVASQPEGTPQLGETAGSQPESASNPEGAMDMQTEGSSTKPSKARDSANVLSGEAASPATRQTGASAGVTAGQAAPAGADAAGRNTTASGQQAIDNPSQGSLANAKAASGQAQMAEKAKVRQQKQKSARKKSSAGMSAARKSGAEAKARIKAGTRARIETGEGIKEYLELKKEFQELHKELEKEIPTGSPEKIFAKSNLEEPKTQAEEALESYRHMILERQGRQIARQNRKFLYTASSFFLVAVCVLGITTINNYRKMQEVEDVLHVMSGNTSEGKRAEGEDGPVVESVMSQVEPLEENGETPSAAGDAKGQSAAGDSQGEGQPATGSSQETDQPEDGNSEGAGQPTSGNGQEANETGSENNQGASQPATSSGQGTNETGSGNSEGTSQPATGSGQESNEADTGNSQGAGTAGGGAESQQPEQDGASSPSKDAEEASVSQPRYYTVKPGDTLGSICISIYHDQSMMAKVCEANGIDNGDKIYVGQKLVLP